MLDARLLLAAKAFLYVSIRPVSVCVLMFAHVCGGKKGLDDELNCKRKKGA